MLFVVLQFPVPVCGNDELLATLLPRFSDLLCSNHLSHLFKVVFMYSHLPNFSLLSFILSFFLTHDL